MTERTTVRLPESLVRRAKRKAAAEGTTLTALIEDGLRRVVNDRAPTRKAKRIMPRVSKATGGLRPGIEPDDLRALQEMEDQDYVRRLR
jgi:hypothetical protein